MQGSKARPYRARIGLATFGKSEWAQVEHALAGNAWYTAMLLPGETPDDIEDGLLIFIPLRSGGWAAAQPRAQCVVAEFPATGSIFGDLDRTSVTRSVIRTRGDATRQVMTAVEI